MKIGTYQLTSLEKNRILVIYEKLKNSFPCIRIDCRKEIIGIGESVSKTDAKRRVFADENSLQSL